MSVWKSRSKKEIKPWGHLQSFNSPFGVGGKLIYLNKGERTSLKYYEHLNQVMYCLSGKVLVHAPKEKEFGDFSSDEGNYFELLPGELILIQATNPYRLMSHENSVLVEVLIGHVNDGLVMIEDDYGRIIKDKTGDKND